MLASLLQSRGVRWKLALGIIAGFMLAYGVVFYVSDVYDVAERLPTIWKCKESAAPTTCKDSTSAGGAAPTDLSELMQHLWGPFLHGRDQKTFTSDEGYHYKISSSAHRWKQPLGKKLLILDVDSRSNTGPGEMLNTSRLHRGDVTGRTGGYMNHYLYALIHGYDYRLVQAPDYKDRHGTWVKVPIIKEALKTHDFVVFMDADAVFMYPHLPMEWLMSLWNIKKNETLVAMAEDPNSETNRDAKGWVLWNTGFIIAQQSERTQQLFDDWQNCPTGRFPGCEHWSKDWAHEQAAFGNYVRYAYNTSDELRAIPCMDGNGAPYIGDKKCGGVFIRHHWFKKDRPIMNLYDSITDLMVSRLHAHFHDESQRYFADVSRHSYPLSNVAI